MKIIKTKLKDVCLISPRKIKDKRGYFQETYNSKKLDFLRKKRFVQENESFSRYKGTFRGIHFQRNPFAQDKLVKVVNGEILDFVIDLRKNSKTFLKSEIFLLSDTNNKLLWIPKGFGHGFLTLKNNTIITYKVTKTYSKMHDDGISIFDKKINLQTRLKLKKFIISKKDKNLPKLDLKKIYF